MVKRSSHRMGQAGQATIEYILILAVVVGFFLLIRRGLQDFRLSGGKGLSDLLTSTMTGDFKAAYQFGHPKARGYEDPKGPFMHPRIAADGADPTNFRIFISPGVPK